MYVFIFYFRADGESNFAYSFLRALQSVLFIEHFECTLPLMKLLSEIIAGMKCRCLMSADTRGSSCNIDVLFDLTHDGEKVPFDK